MPEDREKDKERKQEEAQPAKKSKWLSRIISTLCVILAAAIVGLLLYHFVITPTLTAEASPAPEIPVGAAMVEFDSARTTVVMPPDSGVPASILMYEVSFVCASAAEAAVVEANKPLFVNMLRELHSDHTRESLNNPLLRRSIQAQALTQANELLAMLTGKTSGSGGILKVLHEDFMVYDQ